MNRLVLGCGFLLLVNKLLRPLHEAANSFIPVKEAVAVESWVSSSDCLLSHQAGPRALSKDAGLEVCLFLNFHKLAMCEVKEKPLNR